MTDHRAGFFPFRLTRLHAANLELGVNEFKVVGPVVHGVECYEAWREGVACPHEQEDQR